MVTVVTVVTAEAAVAAVAAAVVVLVACWWRWCDGFSGGAGVSMGGRSRSPVGPLSTHLGDWLGPVAESLAAYEDHHRPVSRQRTQGPVASGGRGQDTVRRRERGAWPRRERWLARSRSGERCIVEDELTSVHGFSSAALPLQAAHTEQHEAHAHHDHDRHPLLMELLQVQP